MKQIRLSDETYRRLQEYADGRPLGLAIERLLDTIDSIQHATEQVREEKVLTHREVFGDPPPVETPLDAEGIPPGSVKGKATVIKEEAMRTAEELGKLLRTCGPGMTVKPRSARRGRSDIWRV